MKDTVGKIPEIISQEQALKEILWIAKDKRGHVLMDEHIEWLELKFKVIRKIARKGLKLGNSETI